MKEFIFNEFADCSEACKLTNLLKGDKIRIGYLEMTNQ